MAWTYAETANWNYAGLGTYPNANTIPAATLYPSATAWTYDETPAWTYAGGS